MKVESGHYPLGSVRALFTGLTDLRSQTILQHHNKKIEARLPQIGPLHSYLLTGFSSNLITVLSNSGIEMPYVQAMFYEK